MKRILPLILAVSMIFLAGAAIPGSAGTSAAASLISEEAAENSSATDAQDSGRTPSWGSIGIIFGVLVLVVLRNLRIHHKTRTRFGINRSYYTRKDFTSKPRAFDDDESFQYTDLD